jgi:predicted PolB exonuclease-like 3'-5' exonuclease
MSFLPDTRLSARTLQSSHSVRAQTKGKPMETDTTFIYFDIETIPNDTPELLARIKSKLKPPANMKKQETIDAWWSDKADDVAKEKLSKTSFDGGRGQVCVISWAIGGKSTTSFMDDTPGGEFDIIEQFFYALPKAKNITLVGHNIVGFDIPFLTKRAICLGVELPTTWKWPRDPKKWGGKNYFDTMFAWSTDTMVGQDELCDILGIEGKKGMDGSKVAAEWAAGNHQKVSDYCASDVETVRKIHQFFLKAGY